MNVTHVVVGPVERGHSRVRENEGTQRVSEQLREDPRHLQRIYGNSRSHPGGQRIQMTSSLHHTGMDSRPLQLL